MADAQIIPLNIEEEIYRYTRTLWRSAGVDNFTAPPNQNPDSFLQLTNVRPPIDGVLRRRFGYATFVPSLDTGLIPGGDQISNAALYGAVFDGVGGYADTLNSKTIPLNSTFSIEFWFETNTTNGGYFVSFNADQDVTNGDTQYTGVYMLANGTIGAGLLASGGVTLSTATTTSYNDGTGHHVVAVFTGTDILLYVDGTLQTTTAYTSTTAETGYWRIANGANSAGWPTVSSYVASFISHVSIWSVALSAAQVTSHYNALFSNNGTQSQYESVVSADGPVFFWYLNETTAAVPPLRGTIIQQVSETVATAGGSIAFPNPVAKGNLIVLCTATQTPAQLPTISDSLGNTYSAINSVPNNSGYGLFNFTAPISTAGACVITVSLTTPKQTSIIAVELHNVNTSIDGSATASSQTGGASVVFASPSITTASAPDLVFSVAYANSIAAPTPGSGSALLSSTNGPSTQGTGSHAANFLGLSYQQASNTGSYGASWTQQGAHLWITATFGITLITPAVGPGGSTTMYDYADANNGTYQTSLPAINSNEYQNYSGPTAFTASGSGIHIGDTGILWLVTGGSSVSAVTDSLGSIWTPLHSSVTIGSGNLYQPWTASMGGNVASGSTFTITLTGAAFAAVGFVNIPALHPVNQSAEADGLVSGTTFSTAGVTTADNEFFFSLAAVGDSATVTTPFIALPSGAGGGTVGANDMGAAYLFSSGTVINAYHGATNGDVFVSFLFSFPYNTTGFSLGEYIIIN